MRDVAIPLVSLNKRLGLPEGGAASQVLLVRNKGTIRFAARIDRVIEIHHTELRSVEEPPSRLGPGSRYVLGTLRREDETLLLLDLPEILDADEQLSIEKLIKRVQQKKEESSTTDEPAAGLRGMELSDVDFLAIRNIIYEACGVFCDNKLVLQNRLIRRMAEVDLDDFRKYYLHLKFDADRADELELLLQEILVNETYFYREVNQLRAFEEEILPDIVANRTKKGPLRIWTAGCSTGEEPYTIAMILTERGIYNLMEVSIFATDLSSRALQKARAGVYTPNSFRGDEMGPWMKYFLTTDAGFEIADSLKKKVLFRKHNLLDEKLLQSPPRLGCHLLPKCHDLLRPASQEKGRENLPRAAEARWIPAPRPRREPDRISDGFRLERLKHDLVYKKVSAP